MALTIQAKPDLHFTGLAITFFYVPSPYRTFHFHDNLVVGCRVGGEQHLAQGCPETFMTKWEFELWAQSNPSTTPPHLPQITGLTDNVFESRARGCFFVWLLFTERWLAPTACIPTGWVTHSKIKRAIRCVHYSHGLNFG